MLRRPSRYTGATALFVAAAALTGVATGVVALRTQTCVELESITCGLVRTSIVASSGWALLLVVTLLVTPRAWPKWTAIATFVAVAGGSAWALVDTLQRTLQHVAPARHLLAPAALFALSIGVVSAAAAALRR